MLKMPLIILFISFKLRKLKHFVINFVVIVVIIIIIVIVKLNSIIIGFGTKIDYFVSLSHLFIIIVIRTSYY